MATETSTFPSVTTSGGAVFGTEENDLLAGRGNTVLYALGGDGGGPPG